ncbi:uncharacterized protein N7483_007520 [Penicillium malachiteum]|uniref:uncharacterized protein n=1 Tax=Penicillium malachiteum TaxID=1324776 RepID=UPI00254693F2|nr:uncharacterized protein N7483_007520 [Penicillium malachiteum]KAJ5726163.1 hypothetical protein N7483_007520 [Penicillium malachiteum]
MHFKFILPAFLLTSSTLATELRLLKRDACSSEGYEDCYADCMPVGAVCCSDGSGTYCNSGYACVTDGCCPEGETCVGGGGTSTYTDYISEETTSADIGSYSTSSVVYVGNPYTTSPANAINYDTTSANVVSPDTTSAAAVGNFATSTTMTSSSVSQETTASTLCLVLGTFMQAILV